MVAFPDIRRGDVLLVDLSPTRPCLVVPPDELNAHLDTLIVAPMTTGNHSYPFRGPCRFHGKRGYVVLDQIRTIGRDRLVKVSGRLPESAVTGALAVLLEMFAP